MEADGVELGVGEAAFGKTLVDSGTTYSYFPPAVFSAWRRVLDGYCTAALFCQRERDGRPCWRATSETFLTAALPLIRLTFQEGSTVSWPPQSYLYRRTGGFWCDGLDDNRMQESVLGLSFFKHKQIIFDRSQERIGAINAKCPNFFLEERPRAPNEVDLTTIEKVSLLPESHPGLEDESPRKSPHLLGDGWEGRRETAALTFWLLFGVGGLLVALFALCRCIRRRSSPVGSPGLGSSPPTSDAFLEAQRRAHEARLAAWEGAAADSSDEEEAKRPQQEQLCDLPVGVGAEGDDTFVGSPPGTTRSQEGRSWDRRLSGGATLSPAKGGLPSLPTRDPAYTPLTKEPGQI